MNLFSLKQNYLLLMLFATTEAYLGVNVGPPILSSRYGLWQSNCAHARSFVTTSSPPLQSHERRASAVVSTPAWHAGDLGSIPGPGMLYLCVFRMRH